MQGTFGRGRLMTALAILLVAPAVTFAQGGWTGQQGQAQAGEAAGAKPGLLNEVRIDQKLDEQIPLDLPFLDAGARPVTLGQYFGKRPVILALVYYECPMLCTQVLNGLVSSLGVLQFNAGQQFEVVVVSFDPGETPGLARDKKASYLERYNRPGTEVGWHFLTGTEASIAKLADAVGFRYAYDERIDQFAHPAAIMVLTPSGHVSRYFYGIEYAPRDMRLGLVEASQDKIGTVVDQALLLCYHYDPAQGRYGVAVMNLVRLGGVLTLAALGAFVFVALRRDRRRKDEAAPTHQSSGSVR
jgi:protein SCO1/2